MVKSLQSLAQEIGATYIGEDVAITAVQINSQLIKPGQLFVAIKAERDGHVFIDNAIRNGAAALLVSQQKTERIANSIPQIVVKDTRKAIYDLALAYRRTLKMPVLALTGSCGKTTTKEMLVSVLSEFGEVHCTQGNLNNDLGVPITLLSAPQNTDFLVVEAGTNAPGEIAYLAALIQPDVAGITNVSASHLEKLKSLDGVMIEKGGLLEVLPAQTGYAIINQDDSRIKLYAQNLKAHQISISRSQSSDIKLVSFSVIKAGFKFTVEIDRQQYNGVLNALGQHNLMNALMTIGFCKALMLDLTKSVNALASFKPYKGRFSLYQVTTKLSIIDDTYNASAQSVKAAIKDLGDFDGTTCLVLSNMSELGEHAEYYHTEAGCWIAAENIDQVYLFGNEKLLQYVKNEVVTRNKTISVTYFHQKLALIEALQRAIKLEEKRHRPTRILVKGSRANKMEEIVAALI